MAAFIGFKSLYVFITVSVLLLSYYGITGAVIITCLSMLLSILIYNIYKINKDIISIIFLVSAIAILINQVYFLSGINGTYVHTITVVLFVYIVIWNIISIIDIIDISGVTEIENNRVYMVFKKPDDLIGIAISLFGHNSSSLSFCMNGKWLRFVKKDMLLLERDIDKIDGFVFIDIGSSGEYDNNVFNSLEGKKWRLMNNCVSVWKPFLINTKYRIKSFDFLPSIYVLRILKKVIKDD